MKRFNIAPVTLYRIQARLPVSLRSYDDQIAKGLTSFDLKLHNGQVLPMLDITKFTTPNGMSWRPAGLAMSKLVRDYKGNFTIYNLLCGAHLPDSLCVMHEHNDHYSLQTTRPISPIDFNALLTDYLKTLPTMTREAYIAMDEDPDQFDM